MVSFSTDLRIDANKQNSYNVEYFFLQRLYYQLGIPTLCKNISKNYSFQYDLNSILSRLIFGRILFPSSKLSCYEQLSLTPLEQQIMKDFKLSKFVVCTDAGLSSESNRKFNNFGERSFITAQSIKKLNNNLKEWCLEPTG